MISYLVFLLLFVHVIFARVLTWMCHSELDCPEQYSCHEKICKKCLKCDVLFRKGNSCVTDFADCGDCLPGYEEVLITDHSTAIKPCKPLKKVKSKKCSNDSSCPQNSLCREGYCVKCFDCNLINRLPPNNNCARSFSECGSCLNGFYKSSVTTNSNFIPCRRAILAVPKMPGFFKMSFSESFPIFILVTVFFGVVFATMFKKFRGKDLSEPTYQPSVYPSAPPLNIMDAPQTIKRLGETEPPVNIVKEERQGAIVFKLPHASYYTFDETREFDDSADGDSDDSGSHSYGTAPRDQAREEDCSRASVQRNRQLEIEDPLDDSNSDLEPEMREDGSVVLQLIDANEIADVRDDNVDSLSN